MAREPCAHYGQIARLGADLQVCLIGCRIEHHARTKNLKFAGERRLDFEQPGGLVQEAFAVRRRVFNLDQEVGAVDRRGQRHIDQAHEQSECNDSADQPFVVEQDVAVSRKARRVVRVDHHHGLAGGG